MINSRDGTTADSAGGTGFGVFSDYRELLFSMVYNLLASVADTEDVLQDTWLAWRGRIAAGLIGVPLVGGRPPRSVSSCSSSARRTPTSG
jgi:hypothetical protein